MCLLNKTPEYIVLFLLILSRNIFGIYGSSGPPANVIKDDFIAGGSSTIAPQSDKESDGSHWFDVLLLILKASIMISIIIAAIFGNLLVIISVMRNRKLR